MEHVGMDLGKKESQIAILTDAGELVEKRIRTTHEQLKGFFGRRPKAKIVIEASGMTEWVARVLEGLGHEVIVADPNYAPMYSQRDRKVKTDRRDALALAEACKLGAYRLAHRVSDEQRHVRVVLSTRATLVHTRVRWIGVIHSILAHEGYRVAVGSARTFFHRLQKVSLPQHLLTEIQPMLAVLETLNEQVKGLDKQLVALSRQDEGVQRLMTVPEIGALTALAYVAALDRPDRFHGAHQVESYLGLVPREWSSSEIQRRGHITKVGNCTARWLLVEAACRYLSDKRPETLTLRQWTDGIARRRGRKIAMVALARRLAGILFAIWRDRSVYDPRQLEKRRSKAA